MKFVKLAEGSFHNYLYEMAAHVRSSISSLNENIRSYLSTKPYVLGTHYSGASNESPQQTSLWGNKKKKTFI